MLIEIPGDVLNGIDSMAQTQKERRRARYERCTEDGKLLLVISTVRVMDSMFPYETAISSLEYNNGGWIVVQCYGDREACEAGHREWKEMMTGTDLPDELVDVSGCDVARLADAVVGSQPLRVKKRHKMLEPTIVSDLWLAQNG